MKIVYFGFNALSSCLDLLVQQNHHVMAVFTGEEETHIEQITTICADHDIDLYQQQPSLPLLQSLVDQGAECFISAEYAYKIPIPENLPYALNIHPTLLPEGRGQTPLPYLILQYPQFAGVTLHKMTNELDAGDILLKQKITIDDEETFDSLSSKVFLQAPVLLSLLLEDIETYFAQAKTQQEGSYWPTIETEQQTIDWSLSTQQIKLRCRAFGSLGVKLSINEQAYYVSSALCIEHEHAYQAGDVISFDHYKLTLATRDGIMVIPSTSLHVLED